MDLLISIVVGVLMVELYAWLPKISEWLIERAVSRLPVADQERYREEWQADLDALPNTVLKLVHATSCYCAIHKINAAIFEAGFDDIANLLNDLSETHSHNVQLLRDLRLIMMEHKESIETRLTPLISRSWYANCVDEASFKATEKAVKALDALSHSLVRAINQVSDLTAMSIARMSARVDQADSLMKTVFEKHSETIQLFRKHKLSPKTCALALGNMHDDLEKLRGLVENPVLNDEDEVARWERKEKILAAIKSVHAVIGAKLKE